MQENQGSEKPAARVAAMLDARQLAKRCRQLEQELENGKKQLADRDEKLARIARESDGDLRYAEFGRREADRLKRESLARLRAIVHFTGDRGRLQAAEKTLSGETLAPGEIAALHQRICDEFQALYPTQPCSHPAGNDEERAAGPGGLDDYRIRCDANRRGAGDSRR
ncbi:MAG: hypothetical protein JXR73_04095 [Candidatus Omnitrophica bacterium]|nr:hypothetical protein [Candidatus Omnitrophota bacterium]